MVPGPRVVLAAAVALLGALAATLVAAGTTPSLAPAAGDAGKRGAVTVLCGFSHAAPDDPIVFPGRAGASHLHQFFGDRTTRATTTARTIGRGRTTCDDPADASGYWVPALVEDGREVRPRGLRVTLERPARSPRVRPLPRGLAVVVGSPRATAAQRGVTWGCTGTAIRDRGAPVRCPVGSRVRLEVVLPSCWDGRRLDSPDHRSHLAALVRRRDGRLSCPRTHAVALPRVTLTVLWATRGSGDLALSSGSGFTGHADLLAGWRADRMRRAVDRCLNAGRTCARDARDRAPAY